MSVSTTPNRQPDHTPSRIYWPAVAAAGAFGLAFMGGITFAALAMSRPTAAPRKEKPLPALAIVPLFPASAPVANEVEPAPPSEPVPTIDVTPPEPAPVRPESGIEQIVANAAVSVPIAVPNPWAPVAPPESPAAVVVKRPPVTCGTTVEFVTNPTLAGRQAQQEHKLLFLLHVSGDFEDPGFT